MPTRFFKIYVVLIAVFAAIYLYQQWPTIPAGVSKLPQDEQPDIAGLEGAEWYGSDVGLIVTKNRKSVGYIYEEMSAAQKTFYEHFGVLLDGGLVYDVSYGSQLSKMTTESTKWSIPWDTSLATSNGAIKTLRHEMSHVFFMTQFWAGSKKFQYGGDAPDWLDEIAAISAEDEQLTEARRQAFRTAHRDGKTFPLSDYFSMQHPAFGSKTLKDFIDKKIDPQRGTQMLILSASEARELGLDGKIFYAQTRAVLDFIISNYPRDHALRDITMVLKAGQSMDDWLSSLTSADQQKLGRSVAEMDVKFEHWVALQGT